MNIYMYTVGECDINIDSGRSGVNSTWRRRQMCMARAVYSRRPIADCWSHSTSTLYTARWSTLRGSHRCISWYL